MSVRRIVTILIIAALLGGINNLVNPRRIDWIGNWPGAINDVDSVWLSPSHEDGDPPTLRLGEAFDRFAAKSHIFIDAREPEEFQAGHIEGAINLPFDSFDEYWPRVEPQLPKESWIVTYCSGTECESSLYLARLLVQRYGYRNIEIFFGGWRAWNQRRLPIEGKYDDELAD